jgi:23S rRNA (cytidine1920-2'-O)/16S rRNA (cytidine1409-2'-O)-methyltransferase
MARKRIDILMVERGLADSRAKAQALVLAGKVLVDGRPVAKPGISVDSEAAIAVTRPPPFVGRGGVKLEHALGQFGLDVSSLAVADIGASTGGFTDCLLQKGARRVYAIDVGYGQIDYRLRHDKRVVVMERVNARYSVNLPEKVDIATVDLSFISLAKVLPSVAGVVRPGGQLVVLVKPQFEARREEVGKGGVIKDPQIHARVIGRFVSWATDHGFRLGGLVASPVEGAAGNREFFVLLRVP